MAIHSVPYVDPTRAGEGEKPDGLAWIRASIQDFAGYMAGEMTYVYTTETYAGANSWGDGSIPVATTARAMAPWRVRNALRSVASEFLAVSAALQMQAAEEIGGVYAPDPIPPFFSEPMETAPEPEPDAGEGD